MGKQVKIQIYNVPAEWAEILLREARSRGMSVSDYVKAYILEPHVKQVMERESVKVQTSC